MDIKEKLNNEDRFAKSIGAQLTEVSEGFARSELTVEEHHLNGAGVCREEYSTRWPIWLLLP